MDLKDHRDKIDAIDAQLLELFKERIAVVSEIAGYKKEHGLSVRDPEREKQMLAALTADSGDLEPYIRRYFKQILRLSREYQEEKTK